MLNIKNLKGISRFLFSLFLCSFICACASQPIAKDSSDAPGFLLGIVNGALWPFELIGHIFSDEIRIYSFPNSGGWYDFGYIIGLGLWGGSAAAR